MAKFNLPFGLNIASSDPTDTRQVVATQVDRERLVTNGLSYEGMIVFQTDNTTHYTLKGTTWEEFGSGGNTITAGNGITDTNGTFSIGTPAGDNGNTILLRRGGETSSLKSSFNMGFTDTTLDFNWNDDDSVQHDAYIRVDPSGGYIRSDYDDGNGDEARADLWVSAADPNTDSFIIGLKLSRGSDNTKIVMTEGLITTESNRIDTQVGNYHIINATGIAPNTNSMEFRIATGSTIFTDNAHGEGIKYAADYGTTFVDRSLVDKKYVADQALTAGNGILIDNGVATWGTAVDDYDNTMTVRAGVNGYYSQLNVGVGAGEFTSYWKDDSDSEHSSYVLPGVTYIDTTSKKEYASGKEISTGIKSAALDETIENGLVTRITTKIDSDITEFKQEHGAMEVSSDVSTFPGITYDADYSGTYTDRSLVDRKYVTDNTVSAGNGLTNTSNVISVGTPAGTYGDNIIWTLGTTGTSTNSTYQFTSGGCSFASDTEVDFGSTVYRCGANFTPSSTSLSAFVDTGGGGTISTGVVLNSNGTELSYKGTTDDIVDFTVGGNGVRVGSSGTTFNGIEYSSDYSTNFTARSLVDRAYVDAPQRYNSVSFRFDIAGNINWQFGNASILSIVKESNGNWRITHNIPTTIWVGTVLQEMNGAGANNITDITSTTFLLKTWAGTTANNSPVRMKIEWAV